MTDLQTIALAALAAVTLLSLPVALFDHLAFLRRNGE